MFLTHKIQFLIDSIFESAKLRPKNLCTVCLQNTLSLQQTDKKKKQYCIISIKTCKVIQKIFRK